MSDFFYQEVTEFFLNFNGCLSFSFQHHHRAWSTSTYIQYSK